MYQKGDLKLLDPPCNEDYEVHEEDGYTWWTMCNNYDHKHSVPDFRSKERGDHMPPCVYLPHSCDEWVIGGQEEIEALIGDLKEALLLFPME